MPSSILQPQDIDRAVAVECDEVPEVGREVDLPHESKRGTISSVRFSADFPHGGSGSHSRTLPSPDALAIVLASGRAFS